MIKKIAFISHRSTDIEADRRFYGELLGLELVNDYGFPGENEEKRYWLEYETPDGKTIAVENMSPEGTKPTLALETDDIEAEVERLKAAGARVQGGVQDNKVCKMAWVLDASGNVVMLHEIAPDRAHPSESCAP